MPPDLSTDALGTRFAVAGFALLRCLQRLPSEDVLQAAPAWRRGSGWASAVGWGCLPCQQGLVPHGSFQTEM